jgi:hypothetical protein
MTLIEIRHFDSNCDVWHIVNVEADWNESECRKYIQAEKEKLPALVHNESGPRDYYTTNDAIPEWQDDAWYDYSECAAKNKPNSTCDTGCMYCPYEESCYILQMRQQLEWIERECAHFS